MNDFDHNSGTYLELDGAKIYYEVAGDEESPALLFFCMGVSGASRISILFFLT